MTQHVIDEVAISFEGEGRQGKKRLTATWVQRIESTGAKDQQLDATLSCPSLAAR
jgi:hypothetical protein